MQLTKLEKMIELQDKTQAGESEKTEAEICEEVPGKSSGFNQNFAFSHTEHHDTAIEAELGCIVQQQENKIKQLEEQLVLVDQQKEKIKSFEQQQFVLLEIMKQLTIALELQQSDKAPTRQPSPSPIVEDSSSSATAISKKATGDT
ncbi:uncharacterized protein LOC116126768 [Pistacia vera]|uniref:uncharacterized protein LOC116126768 n=1 Tax=Pistacia vera TaxID=55513 RepID=UPI001263C6B0|nr:uncharacterized protein LOC116126768 [Pistacia vera]